MKWVAVIVLFLFSSCMASKPIVLPLDGSMSFDKDGYIIKWYWRQITNKDAVIINPNVEITTAILKQKGTYSFELLVMDNDGLVDRDTIMKRN